MMNKMDVQANPNNLEAFWMPFTANRAFKARPRMVVKAEGMYYFKPDGTKVMDAAAGMWCCNAGHNRPPIIEAIKKQAETLDFSPQFGFGYPPVFEYASRLAMLSPGSLDHVFYANSGSEAVDTALKIALAYFRCKGEAHRARLIGRERAYHGVGFGGISVGGIPGNRKVYGLGLNGVDHMTQTYNREKQRFTKGEPEWGAHLAEDLERIVAVHDASTIAAVIVEPMSGSGGVLPPPQGYLKKLREITSKYGILLIFDEVITGFGRLGHLWAAERYGVEPDMITFAKGVTSGTVPMGGVMVSSEIYNTFMNGPEHFSELPHGYTYSGHPLAVAAAGASLDVYQNENLFGRVKELESYWADAAMTLQNTNHVLDIRTLGFVAGIDIESRPDNYGQRAFEFLERMYHEQNVMLRVTGDTIALTPPLTISKAEIDELFAKIHKMLSDIK